MEYVNLRRKLASVEEQNRELISVNARRDDALQQTKVIFTSLLVCPCVFLLRKLLNNLRLKLCVASRSGSRRFLYTANSRFSDFRSSPEMT